VGGSGVFDLTRLAVCEWREDGGRGFKRRV
jgi:hypothetical protein